MAIQNINTIQHTTDLDYLTGVSQEYLVQALANLGQRLGVKGDSILTNEFLFSSLVNGENYDPMKYMGFIQHVNDTYILGICNKNKIKNVSYYFEIDNTENYLITSEVCKLSKIINNIDGYDTNGRIVITDNFYTFGFTGIKYVGETKAVSYEEYICERIDKYANTIHSAIRIRKFGTLGQYKLVYIAKDSTETYQVKVYDGDETINLQTLTDIINSIDVELLSPDTIINTADVMKYFSSTPKVFNNITYKESSGTFIYDFSGEDFSDVDYTANDLSKAITYFAYDLSYLYRYVKKYFSEIVFNYNNAQLKRKIVVELFKLITIENNSTNDIAYIPLNYTFNYAYNSAYEWKIYFNTLDIITKYVKDSQLQAIISSADSSAWICPTVKPERVSMYNYSVDYDPEATTVVYEINAYKHYTLPYINGENYWVLNDIDSNIYAKGINAGNPNIVIIRSGSDCTKPDIISAASYTNVFDKLSWKKEHVLVKRIQQINNNLETSNEDARFIVLGCAVPDLSKINADMLDEYRIALENAIIINMSVVDNVMDTEATRAQYGYTIEEIKEEYGENSIITTLWHLEAGANKFDFLKDTYFTDDITSIQYALDFNYITNVNNQINYAVRNHIQKYPERYLHNYVVFNNAFANTKQEDGDPQYSYPTLRNKQSVDYLSNDKYNKGSEYFNDLNFYVEYNDTVKDTPDNITSVSNSSKRYFSPSKHKDSVETIVTNSLYSYLNGTKYGLYGEYVPNYTLPVLDTAEVLQRNDNVINKVNIISFDDKGNAFNSYIGTSYMIADKSRLVIGSSETNINLGTETLVDFAGGQTGFKTQDTLALNFDTTYASQDIDITHNLYVHHDVVCNGIHWNQKSYNGNSYYTTTYTPVSRYVYEKNSYITYEHCGIVNFTPLNNGSRVTLSNESYMGMLSYASCFDKAREQDKLFVIGTVAEHLYDNEIATNLYISDYIYVPVLLDKLHLTDFVSTANDIVTIPNVILTTNMDVCTYTTTNNGVDTTTPLLLKASTTLLTDYNLYKYNTASNSSADHATEEIMDYTGSDFTGNDLTISYYLSKNQEEQNNLYIDIVENKRKNSMNYIFKLKTNY